jgi:biopolymer transport protein ExbB
MTHFFSVNSPIVTLTLLALLLLSVVTWSVGLYKLWRQLQGGRQNRIFREAFWAARNWQDAAALSRHGEGDLALLAQAGFAELDELRVQHEGLKHLGAPQEVMERLLRQQVQNIQRYHERGLAELATIGSTAPFVGLFGTVWGIMHALQNIGQSGSASLDVVAGPIGEALIATAIGIATALPAVLFYNLFLRRLKVHVTDLDNFAHDFLRLAAKHDFKR